MRNLTKITKVEVQQTVANSSTGLESRASFCCWCSHRGKLYLNLTVEMSGECINPVRLSHGMITARRRPGFHPMYETLPSAL